MIMIKTSFVQDQIMYPASLLEVALTLLLLLVALQCSKLVLALVAAAQNALQAIHAGDQRPLDAGALLERPVQETGAPIGHGNTVLVQARIATGGNYPGAQFVQPVQETQPAFQLQDALQQSVGGLGIAQESLYQRHLPAAMVVASLHIEVSSCS